MPVGVRLGVAELLDVGQHPAVSCSSHTQTLGSLGQFASSASHSLLIVGSRYGVYPPTVLVPYHGNGKRDGPPQTQ